MSKKLKIFIWYFVAPQSPQSQPRQILACKNIRMSSVELPDNNEKSSASPSPCPSPVWIMNF